MANQVQVGVKRLSERGQAALHRLLDEGHPAGTIARVLWLQTREKVASGAITRYASRYRKQKQELQRAKEKLDGFIARMRADGLSISDLLRALLWERLAEAQRHGSLPKKDLLDLEAAERRRGEYEWKQRQAELAARFRERELELKERNTKVTEGKYRMARDQAKTHLQTLEERASGGHSLTNDDMRKIREIYGLYEDGGE